MMNKAGFTTSAIVAVVFVSGIGLLGSGCNRREKSRAHSQGDGASRSLAIDPSCVRKIA